jgi:hypothetical protein
MINRSVKSGLLFTAVSAGVRWSLVLFTLVFDFLFDGYRAQMGDRSFKEYSSTRSILSFSKPVRAGILGASLGAVSGLWTRYSCNSSKAVYEALEAVAANLPSMVWRCIAQASQFLILHLQLSCYRCRKKAEDVSLLL